MSDKQRKAISEAAVKRRALRCRQVRLYLAANPGKTAKEIFEATGLRNSEALLLKMYSMGIVRNNTEMEDGKLSRRIWFVVPQ